MIRIIPIFYQYSIPCPGDMKCRTKINIYILDSYKKGRAFRLCLFCACFNPQLLILSIRPIKSLGVNLMGFVNPLPSKARPLFEKGIGHHSFVQTI